MFGPLMKKISQETRPRLQQEDREPNQDPLEGSSWGLVSLLTSSSPEDEAAGRHLGVPPVEHALERPRPERRGAREVWSGQCQPKVSSVTNPPLRILRSVG